jgi:hypothetical protein
MARNKIDTLKIELKDKSSIIREKETSKINPLWIWTIFLILLILAFRFINNKRKLQSLDLSELKKEEKEKFRNQKVNMIDVMNDINLSKKLYKKLSKKYHPDRFIGEIEHDFFEKIFQEITENQRDYKKLIEIENKINNQINKK